MIIFDTSILVEILNGSEIGIKTIKELDYDIRCTTTISTYELELGIKEKEINKLKSLLDDLEILNFDIDSSRESAKIEKKLKKEGKLINKMDILIAGICKKHNAKLITLDLDFLKIENIDVKIME